jgi:phenylacetate-CoA ligase
MDEVKVNIELSESWSNAIGVDGLSANEQVKQLTYDFRQKIKNNIGLSMDVNVQPFGKIPRSVGGKLSRVKDLRKQ